MTWHENRPQSYHPLSELGGVIRDNKASTASGLEKHFYFSDSTVSAGLTRLSAATGSARAFFAAASQLSAGEAGALMLTSDTERLYGLTSDDTILLGGSKVILRRRVPGATSDGTTPSDTRVLVQSGSTDKIGTGTYNISFTSAYGSTPHVAVTSISTLYTKMWQAAVTAADESGLSVELRFIGAAPEPTGGFYWRSEGTAAL